jgi:hypothetical protein
MGSGLVGSHRRSLSSPLAAFLALTTAFAVEIAPALDAAPRPDLDLTTTSAPVPDGVAAEFERLRHDPELARIGTPAHVDDRFAVPSFLLASPALERGPRAATPEQAARDVLTRLGPYYRLDAADVRDAKVRYVTDTGSGGIIVSLRQEFDGIPVFRDEVKVLLDRDLHLLAVSGHIPGRADARADAERVFPTRVEQAIATALADMTSREVDPGTIRRIAAGEGGYETFSAEDGAAVRLSPASPIRARRVLFRLPEGLVTAYHVELTAEDSAPTYIIAADDGRVLLRHERVLHVSYDYRVWAGAGALPYDGPHGNIATPHPDGLPTNYYPPMLPPPLVSLQNGPISTNDPWLPPGATTTSGNNVDAYADAFAPDGFSAGDVRATTTSANRFDRTFDLNQEPWASDEQRKASVTQMFYLNNFLHDWFYDAGFNEAAGNAQLSNFGRGGLGGDPMLAEAQDYSGVTNANMSTPADGASPRMQFFSWVPAGWSFGLSVTSPASIAGVKNAGTNYSNPANYNVTANLAQLDPGTFAVSGTSALPTGTAPEWVHVADVNGDTRPDLLSANLATNNVSVILSNGSGGFLPKVDYATGTGPYTVVTPDLNNDGLRDLVSANFTAGSISVRLGTGGGAFGAKTDFVSGTNTAVAAVGRFNADAFDDIVTANYGASTASVFLGNGAGGFAAAVPYAMGTNPNWVAVGDLDNDGKLDLVTANAGANSISVRLGTGTGTFGARVDQAVGTLPLTLALGDLNGDTRLDVVTANSGSNNLSVAMGNGTGGFGAPVSHAVPATPVTVTMGDANGDGLLDVAVCSDASNSVSLLAGNGAGGLAVPQTMAVGTTPYGVAIADVNGDGHPDLVSANFGSNDLTVLAGQVTASTQSCAPFANNVTGRIALIDVGTCTAAAQIAAIAARGAVGVVLVHNGSFADNFNVNAPVAIPAYIVAQSLGNDLRAALRRGPVSMNLSGTRPLMRDGALDNLVAAHEWGHYLSNRLIGDASGLVNQQGFGLGEGWADFTALLMEVRAEDAAVASNPDWSGTYATLGHALASSTAPDNAYYFGDRRVPYSTAMNRNPLTFKHITGFGVAFGSAPAHPNFADNFEPHNTGEVWCNVLWECYASLLRATARLTFDQARDRMRRYLVESLMLTPNSPTFLEARDALLTAAYARDPADYNGFCAAFARRGMGGGAVAPARTSAFNSPVVESFVCNGELNLVSFAIDDSTGACDADGYVDANEDGRVTVTLSSPMASAGLSSTTATVTTTNPNLLFPAGHTIVFPPVPANGTRTMSLPVRGAGPGAQILDLQLSYDDPGLTVPGPRTASLSTWGNIDASASTTEHFEFLPFWTVGGTATFAPIPWKQFRPDTASTNLVAFGADPPSVSDQWAMSPPLSVGAGPFGFTFKHAYSFERDALAFYDGGVVEISDNGGASWTDVGAAIVPGYAGTLYVGADNPLGNRSAFVGASPGYPAWTNATASLGTTYAGKTVRIRFRIGTDISFGAAGWRVDDVAFSGIVGTPFLDWFVEPSACALVAVGDGTPIDLSFSVAGANPSRGGASFRFALPRAAHVTLSIYDVAGRRVDLVANGAYPAGEHAVRWGSAVGAGRRASGVYFARLVVEGRALDQRIVVLSP